MTNTILGMEKQVFDKKLKNRKIICIAVAIIMVALNVLFCLLRNDDNHLWMLVANIVVDLAGGWFLIAFVSFHVVPQNSVKALYSKPKTICRGVVTEISQETTRIQGFDCYKVVVGEESQRILFLPDVKNFSLTNGESYQFTLASNIVVEVSTWTKS